MNLLRFANRLSKVSIRELQFRSERYISIQKDRVKPVYKNLQFLSGLSDGIDNVQYKKYWEMKDTFYFNKNCSSLMIDYLVRLFPTYLPAVIKRAERICDFQIPVFGKEIAYENGFFWQSDPLSGKQWPNRHWSQLSVVGATYTMDAKWVWELNRHQFLFPVAIAFWATRDEKYAKFIIEVICDWLQSNRPGKGINWVESQEVALRMTTWLWILEMMKGASALTADHLENILDSIVQHATHISRYPSFYISPNTHLTGEAFGLFLFSCLYPEYVQSADWLEFSRSVMEIELLNQFEDNGIHRELSTYYHCYSIEYYVQFALLAKKNNVSMSEKILPCISRMYDFLVNIARPDGSLPMIGDGDGGRALPLTSESYGNVRSLIGVGAMLLKRPDLTARADGAFEDNIWLYGRDFAFIYESLPPVTERDTMEVYTESNFMVCRFGDKDIQHHLIMNGGKMGFLSAAHSHADYLHIELSLFGVPFLSDPGTYSYKAESWRGYTRSTAAHNTVMIDGKDQAMSSGPFGWRKLPSEAVTTCITPGDFCLMEGMHKCYSEVEHTRGVLIYADTFVLLTDIFRTEGEHHYNYHYHLAPEIYFGTVTESTIELKHPSGVSAWLAFAVSEATELKITTGGREVPKGYQFPRYGNKKKAFTIELLETATKDVVRTTVILPSGGQAGTERPEVLRNVVGGYEELQLRISCNTNIHYYCFAYPSIFRTNCYSACCKYAISIRGDNGLEKHVFFQVTHLDFDKQKVYRATDPVEFIMMSKKGEIWFIETPHCVSRILCTFLGGARAEHIRRAL